MISLDAKSETARRKKRMIAATSILGIGLLSLGFFKVSGERETSRDVLGTLVRSIGTGAV